MSDKDHSGEKQIPFWIDEKMLRQWDEAIKKLGYKSRVERFREIVREDIKNYKK